MKTHQFKQTTAPTKQEAPKKQPMKRETPIWLQIVQQDIRDLLLITKDKIPVGPKPKTESWEDWKENL